MKIILSPSKTLKAQANTIKTTKPIYDKESQYIKNILLDYSTKEIQERFHVSEKLAENIYQNLHITTANPTLFYYTGTVYKQLELNSYQEKHYQYLSNHLYILDALYGCLRYSDEISFYRLDFLCQMDFDLYQYWQDKINKLLMNEDLIINLASQEFSRLVNHTNMVTIDFAVMENNKIKRPSMLIKKARGMMLNYLTLNNILSLEEIKQINLDGYCFNQALSSSNHYLFIKTN